jgi:DNA polymerase I-like protein with 3'-5' exonuclease and polymerase domains
LPDHSIIRTESKEAWNEAVKDIKGFGICGPRIDTTGSDPLSCEIQLAYLTLPDGRVSIADIFGLGNETLDDLAALIEDCKIKKVIHDAKPLLAYLRASQKRRLKAKNIFDIMLASRICWAGYYYSVPSNFGTGIKATKFQVFNTPCQGTGADLIKMVMCELYDRLNSEDARIIVSIHDELLLEVPEERAEEYAKMLSEIMNRIGSELLYPVPVTSEAEILSSWGG